MPNTPSNLRTLFAACSAIALAACAVDENFDVGAVDQELGSDAIDICGGGDLNCSVRGVGRDGTVQAFAAPKGLGADDLAEAYAIPATGEGTPTIAIVVKWSYRDLESDLATYRAHYGMPACTVANGCLRIVNWQGGAELPPEAPTGQDGWAIETMLDLDMASAACPRCKLLVIQGDANGYSLLEAQHTAVALGANVISNSWSTVEKAGQSLESFETYFDQPIAIFAAAGDLGYNQGNQGPAYPATSAHVFSVGGTSLKRDASDRGWSETVWAKGGSSCSLSIAKPAYQTDSPCAFRASADLAAVGDPSTGVAVYHSRNNGGWRVVGGTSAGTPLVAGIFASTGHGSRTAAQLATMSNAFVDVTAGANGSCGSKLCEATTGWDGPTGFGTPNASVLAKMTIDDEPKVDDDEDEDEVETSAEGGCSTSGGAGGLFGIAFAALALLRRRR